MSYFSRASCFLGDISRPEMAFSLGVNKGCLFHSKMSVQIVRRRSCEVRKPSSRVVTCVSFVWLCRVPVLADQAVKGLAPFESDAIDVDGSRGWRSAGVVAPPVGGERPAEMMFVVDQ